MTQNFFQIIDKTATAISKIYTIESNYFFDSFELEKIIRDIFLNEITGEFYINQLNNTLNDTIFNSFVEVSFLPEVTDDEGKIAEHNIREYLNIFNDNYKISVRSSTLYAFKEKIDPPLLMDYAVKYLANKLINNIFASNNVTTFYSRNHLFKKENAKQISSEEKVKIMDLSGSDEYLLDISKKYLLALNLEEMHCIRNYFLKEETIKKRQLLNLPCWPYDIEIETIAQTWSEHCKHKEFNAKIFCEGNLIVDSIFNTYIKRATEEINKELIEFYGADNFLVKVFDDNAGLVKVDENNLLSWKVETHNSPSALDPYGGALTGILGVNRDAVATGIGGAEPLFNTNVLCFASADYAERVQLLPSQMDPKKIISGVVKGIQDGGNKMGIPTINGSIIFDDRFSGKPLVFCGTAALLPTKTIDATTKASINSAIKKINCGDLIISAGGRVGRDGIHGATFSSEALDENSPSSAVQIGSPYTQKILFDFLKEAREKYLINTMTDNGAGGLSSSVGELAQILHERTAAGGANVYLDNVLLKYVGLLPWEIFLSESQERITLVVDKDNFEQLRILAQKYEVEIANIGHFTDDGYLSIFYNKQLILHLDLTFLHKGVPQKKLEICNKKISVKDLHENNNINLDINLDEIFLDKFEVLSKDILSNINICSREKIIRVLDHEVKGQTILKSLMGENNHYSPQDAAVFRLHFNSYKGIAVSNGICPQYAESDPYEMSQGAFDESIRSIISVGGELPLVNKKTNFWSVCDNFCLPNIVYNELTNPDGKEKLAKLVRMCEALYDISTFFKIPLTSGKDSMKNDFLYKDKKISIPPTVLYSTLAHIGDIRNINSSEFKNPGDLIYLLGDTYNFELAHSRLFDVEHIVHDLKEINFNNFTVPKVRREKAKELYLLIMEANENKNRVLNSSHDLSDGGLIVALAESLFANNLGATINISQEKNIIPFFFSESHSRFIVSVSANKKNLFESIFDGRFKLLGVVTDDPLLKIFNKNKNVLNLATLSLYSSYSSHLSCSSDSSDLYRKNL
ncbi:MAG: phosphoribosylformylglycinamidine synthase [Oligoflexia bacterium]|nr:phosphoribosylformylglycinamidine synthase [Oligoflexia bacterium]